MHTIGTIFIIVVLLFDCYVAFDFYRRYKAHQAADPNEGKWVSAFHAMHDSATILWTKFTTVISTIMLFLDPIAELLGGDEAKNAMHEYIGNPKIWAADILGITTVTFFARMRSIAAGMNMTVTQSILKVP